MNSSNPNGGDDFDGMDDDLFGQRPITGDFQSSSQPPEFKISTEDLEWYLRQKVFGQDEAVDAICDALELFEVGIQDPDKPLGAFIFKGPTGVGKTELAKALADFGFDGSMVRVDMGNFAHSHTVANLLGAPPGYVGHNQTPKLAEVTMKSPCVLLLDEIEKAHPDVLKALLSILDDGEIQLMNGEHVDLRDVVIIMTSNVGAQSAEAAMNRKVVGFANDDHKHTLEKDAQVAREQAYMAAFAPEFRGRITPVDFNHLEADIIRMIAEKVSGEFFGRINKRHPQVKISLSEEALGQLTELGYDQQYGARPMKRAVELHVALPLARLIKQVGFPDAPTSIVITDLKNFDVDIKTSAPQKRLPPAPPEVS